MKNHVSGLIFVEEENKNNRTDLSVQYFFNNYAIFEGFE